MTEVEWEALADPTPMLEFLRDKVSERKLRLWSAACCRRTRRFHVDASRKTAVEVAERFADGLATDEDLRAAAQTSGSCFLAPSEVELCSNASFAAAVEDAMLAINVKTWSETIVNPAWEAAIDDERGAQAALLRDIIGNPFRPVFVSPTWLAWNDCVVSKIAQEIYDDRAFDRLPLLAGALEEAGCTDAAILDHCRGGSEHVRGCWVVDLLLRKS